jgi:hypothetical protein
MLSPPPRVAQWLSHAFNVGDSFCSSLALSVGTQGVLVLYRRGIGLVCGDKVGCLTSVWRALTLMMLHLCGVH